MLKLKEFYSDTASFENDLKEMANAHDGKGAIVLGGLLSLVALPAFYFSVAFRYCNCNNCSYWSFAISILLSIAAIICFLIYKSTKQKQAKFQEERIMLRDLCTAISLTENLPENRIKDQIIEIGDDNGKVVKKENEIGNKFIRSEVASRHALQEKIIQMLINRYSN